MHELSLMADLMNKISRVARAEGAEQVTVVRVTLGALSHMSPEHFREHFYHAARGGLGEGAALEIEVDTDTSAASAQDIVLRSIDVAVED